MHIARKRSHAAEEVDREILAALDPKQRAALGSLLQTIGATLQIFSTPSEPKAC